ncbi:MAG: MAPEG family protein [Hyphomicrobiales bacterium]
MTPAKQRSSILGRGPFGFSRKTWPFVKVLVGNWLFAIAFYVGAKQVFFWQPESWEVADRLSLIIKDAVFAILPAVIAVAIVAAQRLNPDMWVGQRVKPNSALDINTRFILNTFEQFTLYFTAQAALCLYAPIEEARSMPLLTVLFVLGRILFWIGYHKNPYLRAFGFGLTFYPTCGAYFWLLVVMLFGVRIPI